MENFGFIKEKYFKIVEKVTDFAKKIILPGFRGNSLYYVIMFFVKGIKEGTIGIRAASVAFSFFMAIFPALIFLFSLIPFLPFENFQTELLELISDVLPIQAYQMFDQTINDTILQQRTSVLSIGFVLLIYFVSSGFAALIGAFNASYHTIKPRNWFSERFVSLILVFIVGILLIIAISLIIIGNTLIVKLLSYFPYIDTVFINILLNLVKWLIIILLYFVVISILYYVAPINKSKMKLISPGAIFATFFQIISILAFSYYVANFAQYNKLYGSIGTIMIVMMLFYISAWVIILGYELNVTTNSIESIINKKDERNTERLNREKEKQEPRRGNGK
ncbi:MAG: YihY/virulence factor BrkB family protein [Bacteroidales bacterium]|jgi:membrane protein|nr:YihY/virulence factor BrkB family protein [Bacteroidales bacterium]